MSGAKRSKDQDLIDWLAARMEQPATEATKANGHARAGISWPSPVGAAPTDEMVIEKCRGEKRAAKFSDLFDHGDVHTHNGGDDSAADLALLDILRFWTQDEAQLERLVSQSALGQREKWRRRDNYRKPTIRKALSDVGEVYDWSREPAALAARPLRGSAASAADEKDAPKLELVTFTTRKKPGPREFVVSDLIPRHHPTTLYGWGGTAKSLMAVLLGLSVAGGREEFFGRAINVHGPVLYLDFELDADEQHRRVEQLTCGMKMEAPETFKYTSALGFRTQEAVEYSLGVCEEHDIVVVILDSLGPAMVGDMAAARDVIGFHNSYIAPFKAIGVTPILVDHQARQQSGEGYQAKGAFGSAYKEHLSRSLIQVEAGDRGTEQGALNIRLRHKKTNFGALADPFDVSLAFSDEMIVASTRELTPSDRAQEATLNADDRVVAALEDGPAYPDEIAETTGLARGTVKNKITALKKAGQVEATGQIQGQMEQVQLAALAARPIKGSAAGATPVQSAHSEPETVAEFFAEPPLWLADQLEIYRRDPDTHFKPLCTAVAAVVLGDGLRGEEVAEEVRGEVGE